jgi:hypothetical protein
MKLLSIFLAVLLAVTSGQVSARRMRGWTYQELMDKSDLVMIGFPKHTKDTKERIDLPNFFVTRENGKRVGLPVVGVESTFRVSLVLKGDKSLEEVTLHHYRLANEKDMPVDGPSFVAFGQAEPAEGFLMFLLREADGRYAPCGGKQIRRIFLSSNFVECLNEVH